MRMKSRPVRLKKPQPCRLCGQPVTEGYLLTGAVKGCACEACHERFYGPLIEKTAFHGRDILTRDFWRPYHIEEGVVMFPALSAGRILRASDYLRRGLPILLAAAWLCSGPEWSMLTQIPGQLLYILSQAWTLLTGAGGHLVTAAGHLPPVMGHLMDAAGRIAAGILQIGRDLCMWIQLILP